MALPININEYQAIIPTSAFQSQWVSMGADTLVGIWMPPTWTTAALTFQISPDGGTTVLPLFNDSGTLISITAAAATFIALVAFPNNIWRGINMLKVRSGTPGSPVVQTAGAIVTLIGRSE